ncbi:hypothetical protein ONE63_000564 [Megalurothrips usitatus]|uniref:Cuticle protein 16.5-like n=1 Tax=Megalurothrips usitatus TaxID=439358 RepID=A0AAV7Y5N3_9NEOP|nr:hypothetical protein ONE63_000564 [Megalurothrips usitatus]
MLILCSAQIAKPWQCLVIFAVVRRGVDGTSHDPGAPSKGYVYEAPPPALAAAVAPAAPAAARGFLAALPDGYSFVYAVQHPDPESTSHVEVSRSSGGRALTAASYPAPAAAYLPAAPILDAAALPEATIPTATLRVATFPAQPPVPAPGPVAPAYAYSIGAATPSAPAPWVLAAPPLRGVPWRGVPVGGAVGPYPMPPTFTAPLAPAPVLASPYVAPYAGAYAAPPYISYYSE